MPNLVAALRNEIRRLAAKEVRVALRPVRRLQRHIRGLKLKSRANRRALSGLERRIARLGVRARGILAVPPRRGRPLTAKSIRDLRSRLRMTRVVFAKLVGVSPGSIFGWEKGRTTPRGASQARVSEIRQMGARAAREAAPPPRRRRRRKS